MLNAFGDNHCCSLDVVCLKGITAKFNGSLLFKDGHHRSQPTLHFHGKGNDPKVKKVNPGGREFYVICPLSECSISVC